MFKFKLVGRDGTSVEPEWFVAAVPTLRAGEQLIVNPALRYRIVEVLAGDEATQAVLVVERK